MNKSNYLSIGQAAQAIGVNVATLRRWDKNDKFPAIRKTPSSHRYYREQDIQILLSDPVAIARHWASGREPTVLDPNYYCRTRDVFQARLETLQNKLTNSIGIQNASLVTAIVGEVGNNSYDHNLGNWPDDLGVFFAYTLNRQEIVLADRGRGILATLSKVDHTLVTHNQALLIAFTKKISGRPNEGRGNGLKFVRQVVTTHPINLTFQTGNVSLELNSQKTQVKPTLATTSLRGCMAVIKY